MTRVQMLLPLIAAAFALSGCASRTSSLPPSAAHPSEVHDMIVVPPPTGDGDIVQPPPSTASKMPVIRPPADSPVIPNAQ